MDQDRKIVIRAIKDAGFNVTARAVSLKTGLSLNSCNFYLNKIAARTSAQLQVSESGTVIYDFDRHFEQIIAARDARTWRKAISFLSAFHSCLVTAFQAYCQYHPSSAFEFVD